MKRECQRCQFYQSHKDQRMGACKRHPPVPLFMGMQQHPVTRAQIPLVIANFPTMDRDDWCGEFEQRGMSREEVVERAVEIDWTKLKPHGETQ